MTYNEYDQSPIYFSNDELLKNLGIYEILAEGVSFPSVSTMEEVKETIKRMNTMKRPKSASDLAKV